MAEDLKARLINPGNTGGVPIFVNDVIQAQDNNRNTVIERCEYLRSSINIVNYYNGVSNVEVPAGLILSGCIVDQTASTYVVSEGYVYLDGEIIKYNGESFDSTSYPQGFQIWLKKGAEVLGQRVFKDAINKNATKSFTVDTSLTNRGVSGAYPPAGYESGQSICISGSDNNMARYYTIQSGLGLFVGANNGLGATSESGVLANYDNPQMVSATKESYTTGSILSRVKENVLNQASFSCSVDTTTFVDGTYTYNIATLLQWNKNTVERHTAILPSAAGTNVDLIVQISIEPNGVVTMRRPTGQTTWATIDGGTVYALSFSLLAISSNALAKPDNGFDLNYMTKS
jgi:hypothetical protein